MKTLPMSGRKNAKKATMTKTYLALALLITVLAGNAYGEDECMSSNESVPRVDLS